MPIAEFPIESTHLAWLGRTLDLYVVSEKLRPEELIGRLSSLRLFSYSEGTKIVTEGDSGRDLFILHKGTAMVLKGDKRIAQITPGDLFGEVSFLVGVPRTATVQAGIACEAFQCEAKGFEELFNDHPHLIESMRTITKLRMQKLDKESK